MGHIARSNSNVSNQSNSSSSSRSSRGSRLQADGSAGSAGSASPGGQLHPKTNSPGTTHNGLRWILFGIVYKEEFVK
jgi:hypothetical protein